MKKLVCPMFKLNMKRRSSKQHQQAASASKLYNYFRIVSKILTGDEMYIPFLDVPTRQECNSLKMTSKQQCWKTTRNEKKMYTVFFRRTRLVKDIQLEGQKTVKWYSTKEHLTEILQDVNVVELFTMITFSN